MTSSRQSAAAPKEKRKWSEAVKNYWLDLALFFAFIIDMNTRFTGLPIHEWLGIAFGVALVYHLMLHWQWIARVTRRLFGKAPAAQRFRYIVDLVLFVDMVVVVISGVWISRVALPGLALAGQPALIQRELHHLSSEFAILLVAIHLALDWKWIVTNSQRYLIRPRRSQRAGRHG